MVLVRLVIDAPISSSVSPAVAEVAITWPSPVASCSPEALPYLTMLKNRSGMILTASLDETL
ncbi:MAG: hypothetical protein V8T86_07655 [Victivallis sp.]